MLFITLLLLQRILRKLGVGSRAQAVALVGFGQAVGRRD
jgi:hypothetical protein